MALFKFVGNIPQGPQGSKVFVKPIDELGILPATVHKVSVDTPAMTEQESMTQEYILLWSKFEEIEGKKLVARMEDIKKKLQLIATETMAEDKPAIFKCVDGELEFGPRGTVREVKDIAQLIKDLNEKFGPEIAFSVVKIGLTELNKILSELEQEKYV